MENPTSTNPNPGSKQLRAYVERILAAKPDFDWKPTIEPPNIQERKLVPCIPPTWKPQAGSVDSARQIIWSGITDYLKEEKPEDMAMVKASPGIGKTTAAIQIVEQLAAAGHRIQYAGPRHDFFQDILAKSNAPNQWYEWQPRQTEDQDTGKIQTCLYASQISEWLNKGYAAMDFCSGVCGWDYVKTGCVYHAQSKRPERIIFTQHQHVAMGHPMQFSVLFGDESPIGAFVHEWRIPGRWILPAGMDTTDAMTEIIFNMMTIAQNAKTSIQGPELLEFLGGPDNVLQACQSYKIPTEAVAYGTNIHRPEQAGEVSYFHLPALVSLLQREAGQVKAGQAYPHRIILAGGFLSLLLRHKPEQLPFHVIWLDATGQSAIYERIFGRKVRVIDATARQQGKIYQVVDRTNGKSSILKDGKTTIKASQAKDLINRIIRERNYQMPSVISYKDFVVELENIKIGHFYAARGTNEYEDVDAIFIVGAPQPDIYSVVRMAKMIFFERDTAFRVEWISREQPYHYIAPDGQGRAYPVSGFWNDPDLQTVLEAMREDEIIQAAHRSRPVNHLVDIWLLTNIPIPSLPPDELLTMREIMDAPVGVNIFKWEKVQKLMDEKDSITISDIVELGIQYRAASKYLDLIANQPGWEKAVVKTKTHGRAPKTVQKQGLFAHYIFN